MIKGIGAVVVAGGLAGCGCDRDDLYEAFQDSIRNDLAIPSSAEFQPIEDATDKAEGECAISMNGWVDAGSATSIVRFEAYGTASMKNGSIAVDATLGPVIDR